MGALLAQLIDWVYRRSVGERSAPVRRDKPHAGDRFPCRDVVRQPARRLPRTGTDPSSRIDHADPARRAGVRPEPAPGGHQHHLGAASRSHSGMGHEHGHRRFRGDDVSGYAGDGLAAVPDFFNNTNVIGGSAPITNFGLLTIDLNPTYVQSLLNANHRYLGLLTVGRPNGFQSSFASTEYYAQFPTLYIPPTLAINVPEPTAASVCVATTVSLTAIRRRRRLN